MGGFEHMLARALPVALTISVAAAAVVYGRPLPSVAATCTNGTCTITDNYSVTLRESCSTFSASTNAEPSITYSVFNNASTPAAGAQVTYTVKCTQGSTTPAFQVDGGSNATSGMRRLKSGGDFLTYNLCDSSACANTLGINTAITLVNAGPFIMSNTPNGTGSPLQFGFYPVISAGQDVPASTAYADSVNVTINW
jgi:Spore Coat Protein U domain